MIDLNEILDKHGIDDGDTVRRADCKILMNDSIAASLKIVFNEVDKMLQQVINKQIGSNSVVFDIGKASACITIMKIIEQEINSLT